MREHGSASLLVVSVLPMLLVVALMVADLARLADIYLQAQTAADAAALAAAPATHRPGADPYAEAAGLASANGARLIGCACPLDLSSGSRVVTVEVAMDVERWIIPAREVRVRSRAEYVP